MAVEVTRKHERAVVIILAVLCLVTWSAVAVSQKDKVVSLTHDLTTRVVHIKSGGQVKFGAGQSVSESQPSIQNVGNVAGKAFSAQ